MGGSSTTLSIVLKLVDDASAAMQSVGASFKSVGASMESAGASLSLRVTAPLVALGTAAFDASTKFEASMELIRTQAGATQDEVEQMTQAVLKLSESGATGQGPQQLADGLYHLESLGLRGADAMKALTTAAQAADTGLANMEGVTNALGAAVVTGIKGTQDYTQAMGLLDATIGAGNMRMEDLVSALGTGVLPAAKNFGLSLQDVGAALATLTDNGMRADEAATRLRMTFSLMAAPSGKAKKVLTGIGLDPYQLAQDMRDSGLVGAIDDLNEHLKASGLTATQQAAVISEAFGGGRSSAAIETLLQQAERLRTKFDQIGAQAGTFGDKVAATHETNLYKFNEAMAQVQATLIDLGGTIMPIVATGLQGLAVVVSKLAAAWDMLPAPVRSFVAVALMLLAALGPILLLLGSIFTVVGTLTTIFTAALPVIGAVGAAVLALGAPLLIVIAATAALAVAVYTHWSEIIGWTSDMMLAVAGAWNKGWQSMSDFLMGLLNDIKIAVQDALNFVMGIVSTITSAINSVKSAASSVIGAVSSAAGAVGGAASGAIHAVIPHLASGGIVSQPTLALIGEAGPEAVVPLRSMPLYAGGGGINITITGNTISNQVGLRAVAQAMSDEIVRVLRTNQKLSI